MIGIQQTRLIWILCALASCGHNGGLECESEIWNIWNSLKTSEHYDLHCWMNHDSGIFVDVIRHLYIPCGICSLWANWDAQTLRLYDCEHLLTPRDFKAGRRVGSCVFLWIARQPSKKTTGWTPEFEQQISLWHWDIGKCGWSVVFLQVEDGSKWIKRVTTRSFSAMSKYSCYTLLISFEEYSQWLNQKTGHIEKVRGLEKFIKKVPQKTT